MRDWLRKAGLNRQPIVLALLGLGLAAIVGVGLFATYSSVPQSVPPVAEPPPQAPVSVSEPTPVLAVTQPTTEPSPFAGIAQPPAEPPHRGGPVQHTVTEGEVLWQIAEQYGLRPETVLWANDLETPDLLLVGQLLLIPPADGVLYTVRPGDRL